MTSDFSEEMEAGEWSGFPSRSDDVNLAVGFNLRWQGIPPPSRQRRLNSIVADATGNENHGRRGLKPTAKFRRRYAAENRLPVAQVEYLSSHQSCPHP
jgi:hypothetical protein